MDDEMTFEQWYRSFSCVFNVDNFTPEQMAKAAWQAATELEKRECLKTIDDMLNSEDSYEFYKKNPDLA